MVERNSEMEDVEDPIDGAQNCAEEIDLSTMVVRAGFGGTLMGLANLVPGISGGTMLLAAGIYPKFIDAVAEITRFRVRFRSLLLLGCVVIAAGLGILLFAGLLKDLVVHRRWIMYSLFIGLTLGGLPIVWRLARPVSKRVIVAGIATFTMMVILAVMQARNVVGSGGSNPVVLFGAGLAGASAMILPGLSGGYLLLLMGQYVPILSAIDEFKNALKMRDFAVAMTPAISVLLPVGLGVLAGVAMMGNLLQWLLKRFRKVTLGALMGLLVGSVVGLWPFQQGVTPQSGDTMKGQTLTVESAAEIDPEDWPTAYFRPSVAQFGSSLVLIAIGFGLTIGIGRIGADEETPQKDD